MGKYLSTVLGECKRQNCDASIIRELYSLERKVIHKLEEQASKLYITTLNDQCLPIVCAVQNTQKILLKVESATRDEVRKKVHELLRGNYLEELVNLLTENLNNALESSTIGAEERSFKYVVFANKSVLRVDVFVYYEALTSCEALAKYKNILAYYMQVGLPDMAKTRPQVLTYELTRATEENKLNHACEWFQVKANHTRRLHNTLQYTAKYFRDASIKTQENDDNNEPRNYRLLESFSWASFGKIMALVIVFTIYTVVSTEGCKSNRWMGLADVFFGISKLNKLRGPGFYLLYFTRL